MPMCPNIFPNQSITPNSPLVPLSVYGNVSKYFPQSISYTKLSSQCMGMCLNILGRSGRRTVTRTSGQSTSNPTGQNKNRNISVYVVQGSSVAELKLFYFILAYRHHLFPLFRQGSIYYIEYHIPPPPLFEVIFSPLCGPLWLPTPVIIACQHPWA